MPAAATTSIVYKCTCHRLYSQPTPAPAFPNNKQICKARNVGSWETNLPTMALTHCSLFCFLPFLLLATLTSRCSSRNVLPQEFFLTILLGPIAQTLLKTPSLKLRWHKLNRYITKLSAICNRGWCNAIFADHWSEINAEIIIISPQR